MLRWVPAYSAILCIIQLFYIKPGNQCKCRATMSLRCSFLFFFFFCSFFPLSVEFNIRTVQFLAINTLRLVYRIRLFPFIAQWIESQILIFWIIYLALFLWFKPFFFLTWPIWIWPCWMPLSFLSCELLSSSNRINF